MALDPQYFSYPIVGSNVPSATADNTLTAPAHYIKLLDSGAPRGVADGVTNSTTTVTSATAVFQSTGDLGRPISGAGIPAGATITAVASTTSCTISVPATASASGVALTLGGGFGTDVSEIDWIPNGSPPVLGVITIFLYDGTTYHLRDAYQVNATPTNSSTVAPVPVRTPYTNLWIPPTWSIGFSSTVASQLVTVTAFGANA